MLLSSSSPNDGNTAEHRQDRADDLTFKHGEGVRRGK